MLVDGAADAPGGPSFWRRSFVGSDGPIVSFLLTSALARAVLAGRSHQGRGLGSLGGGWKNMVRVNVAAGCGCPFCGPDEFFVRS